MKHARKFVYLIASLWLIPALVLAQADCPEIIRAALDATDEACNNIGRNQACYGNIRLLAEPQEGVADFTFSSPGNIVDVAGVRTLTLLPWDADDNVWGIALLQLQTSLPDTLPGQNVTFLLFGDVQIDNAVETNTEPVTFEITAQGNVNVRSIPSADGERVAGLSSGDSVIAIGRNEDSSWLQIELADGITGWVSADFMETTEDITILNIIDSNAEPTVPLNPMQAFYFRSGIADAPCAEAPDSGILVQTPEGAAQVEFTVNEVNIVLGSTIYLQAQPGGDMTISVVEGSARVEATGVTVYAPAGTRVRVPLNNNRQASGPPIGPEPYGDLSVLPVGVLEQDIVIAAPLTEAGIEAALSTLIPISGTWRRIASTCNPETIGMTGILTIAGDGDNMVLGTAHYVRIDNGVYRFDTEQGGWWIMYVMAPDYLELEDNFGCLSAVELVSAAESESASGEVTSPGGG